MRIKVMLFIILSFGILYAQEDPKIKIDAVALPEDEGYRIIVSGFAELPDRTIVLLTIDKDWKVKLEDKEVMQELRNWYESLGIENKWYWRMRVKNKKFRMERSGFPKYHLWAGNYMVKVVVKKWDQYIDMRKKISKEQYNYVGRTTLKIGHTGEISEYIKKEIPKMMEYYKWAEKVIPELEEILEKDGKKIKQGMRNKANFLLEELDKFLKNLMETRFSMHGSYNKARLQYTFRHFWRIFSRLKSELYELLNPPEKVPEGAKDQQVRIDLPCIKKELEFSKRIFCHEFFFLQRVEELKLLKEDWAEFLSLPVGERNYLKKLKNLKESFVKIHNAHLEMERLQELKIKQEDEKFEGPKFDWEPYKKLAERKNGLKYDLNLMEELIKLLQKEIELAKEGEELEEDEKVRLNNLMKALRKRLEEETKKKEEPK